MKVLALAALLLAAAIYALTVGRDGGWGYVNAASEAAMVGALADWFAVTALFRHPLGLPIPHTAIIPTRKDELGASLQEFVAGNFLTEPVVRAQLAKAEPARRAGSWLSKPQNAERVVAEASTAARGVLRVLRDEDVAPVLHDLVLRQVANRSWSPAAGRMLNTVVVEGGHHGLVDVVADHVHRWLLNNKPRVIQLVTDQAPLWTPTWVDERVANRVYETAVRFVGEVRDQRQHQMRRSLDDALTRLAARLQDDDAVRDRFDEFVRGVTERHDIRDAVLQLWAAVRQGLVEAIENPDSELRRRAVTGLTALGRRLLDDEALAARVDLYVEDAVAYVAANFSGELVNVIGDTVQRWDGEETSRLVELHVGRDLQFIRLNGTLVGALVGLVIHTVTVALQ
jgi:uncharacterized membrane-anchored protein YjiN (DUF445 family)